MAFKVGLTPKAEEQLAALDASNAKRAKKARKALGFLESNPLHPGLRSHPFKSLGPDVWESCVENKTPSAWRIFWRYGPGQREITVFAIVPHPD